MPASKYPNVSIIGTGNVGASLAVALHNQGYPIVSVISRNGRTALAVARATKCRKVGTVIEDVSTDSDLILIATPDGAVADVAKRLAQCRKLKFKKLFVAHTSGVHSADVLAPLKRRGAVVASLHPIQSFPAARRAGGSRFKGIFWGIEGEPEAIARANLLVSKLGGNSIVIPGRLKPLYHSACVFASSYLVVFLNALRELSNVLDLKASWTEVFGPLMTTAMESTVKLSTQEALTGPILRGDVETVDRHLTALANDAPQLIPLYTIGGIEVARIAKEHGRIGQQEFDDIVSRFRRFIRTAYNPKEKERPVRITHKSKVKH